MILENQRLLVYRMRPSLSTWRTVAWNGIRFDAPASWDASKIGGRYLLLESGAEPVMEIRWEPITGRFSHRKHLRRLSGGRKGRAVTEAPLSADWEEALQRFDALGFAWSGNAIHARGAILFCPVCRTASLIQFFQPANRTLGQTAGRVLSSFRDHPEGGLTLWSMFDVKARIPNRFTLSHHRFQAGRFEMGFADTRRRLTLYRWGPAEILLKESDLARFAGTQVVLPDRRVSGLDTSDNRVAEWQTDPPETLGAWLRRRMMSKTAFRRFRVWHRPAANRILGALAEGGKAFDPELFERICAGYETV